MCDRGQCDSTGTRICTEVNVTGQKSRVSSNLDCGLGQQPNFQTKFGLSI